MIEKIFFCAECNYRYGNLFSMLETAKCPTCKFQTATVFENEVQLHGIVMVDKSRNSQLSYERQLELLKSNIAVTLKRIDNFKQTQDAMSKDVIDYIVDNINALTGISIKE